MFASSLVFLLGVVMLMVTRWCTGPAPGDHKSGFATAVRVVAWILDGRGLRGRHFPGLPGWDDLVRGPGRHYRHGL